MTCSGLDIEVCSVSVRYGTGNFAIEDVSLRIAPGELVVILGPSGCGKSTLVNCIGGFVTPTSGSVLVGGVPVLEPEPSRGFVFQRDVLFPWASAGANLSFALKAAGVARKARPEQALRLLAKVGLSAEVAGSLPHELSGGMRQRVGIARMMASSPNVMLMDEPFGALDALTRLRMQDLATSLWQGTGATVVFITHDIEEAIRLGDTLVILGPRGRVLERILNPLTRPRSAARLAEMDGYAGLRHRLHNLLGVDQGASEDTGGWSPNDAVALSDLGRLVS
jgi:ABC-type nitrate/sulfonate/bicarbonate transport system ATPase subunit